MPLAYYSRAATKEFWTEHWGAHDPETLVRFARRSPLTAMIESALPRSGRILEAGCGLGQYVILLRERGYATVGVDWSFEALRSCQKSVPNAPVGVMDLGALGVKDRALVAYLSLGVVEHDPAGPDRILQEAHRVLTVGGHLIISVPYLNGVRRLGRPFLSRYQARLRQAGGEFYQYAFTRREVRGLLDASGFEMLSATPYDPARLLRKAIRKLTGGGGIGVDARVPGLEGNDRSSILRLARTILYSSPLLRLLGHMILFVAAKR